MDPVQVGTAYDNRGREKHTAASTAPRCGFSADYDSRARYGIYHAPGAHRRCAESLT
ncbi:mobile element transfer protein [Streptomyces griseus]|uniref:mobile element transfer protein n=1 Tax=Streptomyces griseus TaxID=1911 RepID=UPI000D1441C0|nr:mobile element transfer protein [Streptomyces griseus]